VAGACSSPLAPEPQDTLHRSVIGSVERETRAAEAATPGGSQPRTLQRRPSTLVFKPETLEELEKMAGPTSYPPELPPMGDNLLGTPTDTFPISLRQAIVSAVEQNLTVQLARLEPAISEQQALAAQAAFDWVFFADYRWANIDSPQATGPFAAGADATVRESHAYTTGLRKPLTTGGAFRAFQGQTYVNDSSPGVSLSPDPSNQVEIGVELVQPLLRNFGSEVALSEVRLSQNAERDSIYRLKGNLNDIVTLTERAYWDLVLAERNLRIQQRLLERGIETRDVLESRRSFDVKPAEFSDAVANVQRREGNVIRAINSLRQASDRLKVLINDPELTIGTETLLIPADTALDQPITYALLDAITTALAHRPELQRAILAIDDSSIRIAVAENGRLPMLDFAVQAAFRGLDESVGDAYSDALSARYVDYILSLNFEQPVGNRAAEAEYRARQLERQRATVGYRRAVQQIVLDVKTAMRNVDTNYKLIEQSRSSRLAATENLRTLLVLERTIQALTPDFLDLKFRRQEALALAEFEEAQALVDYNTALADLAQAMGVALDRNQIKFDVPDAGRPDPDAQAGTR